MRNYSASCPPDWHEHPALYFECAGCAELFDADCTWPNRIDGSDYCPGCWDQTALCDECGLIRICKRRPAIHPQSAICSDCESKEDRS